MRTLITVAFLAFSSLTYAGDSSKVRHVYLSSPEALEQLARENPAHHAKVQRILAEIQKQPIDSVRNWMKAEFGAENVLYTPSLLTSDPAKKYVRFNLDDTRYTAVLTQPRIE